MASNYTIDPNTGNLIPTPGVDPGPDYANNVSISLLKLGSLTHTGAANEDGLQIPSAGLNINADVSFQSNNATNLRSIRLVPQTSNISGSGDINCLYDVNGNLWFNNGSGTEVQITAGSVLVTSDGYSFPQQTISVNTTLSSSNTKNSFLVNASSGPIIVTLPAANTLPVGRFYFFYDQVGISNTNNITIRTSNSDTINGSTSVILNTNDGSLLLIGDGVSTWSLYRFAQSVYGNEQTLTFANGSTLQLNSGSLVNGDIIWSNATSAPFLTQQAPLTDIPPPIMTIRAANAYSGAVNYSFGGTLILSSGNGTTNTSGGLPGALIMSVGSESDGYYTLFATQTETELYAGGTLGLTVNTGSVVLEQTLLFDTNANATISQITNTSGSANNMNITAQSSTFTNSTGGNLTLSSGTGLINNGEIVLQVGGSNVFVSTGISGNQYIQLGGSSITLTPSIQINNWSLPSGSFNTQSARNVVYNFLCSTTASGSNVLLGTFNIANNPGKSPAGSGVIFTITWFQKPYLVDSNGLCNVGTAAWFNVAPNTMSGDTNPVIQYVGGVLSADNTDIVLASFGTNVTIAVHAQSYAADWQVNIVANYI